MNQARFYPTKTLWIAIGLILLLAGCFPPSYFPGQQAVGNLRVTGDQVMHNYRPAIDGDTVMSNDVVTTGANSSANIYCYDCGNMQMEDHTDPRFNLLWHNFNPNFVIDTLRTGQVYVEMKKDCLLTVKPEQPIKSELEAYDIKYNVKVNQDETIVTVSKGTVQLKQPSSLSISAGEQVIITKEGVKVRRKLTAEELRDVIKWRDKFPEPGPLVRTGARKVCECVD